MVLAKIISFPTLYEAKKQRESTGTYYYISSSFTSSRRRRLCQLVLKIIPHNFKPKPGDIVNVRDATGKKPQITIIQHDRPVSHPVELVLDYYRYELYFDVNTKVKNFPYVILEPNDDVVHFWTDYEDGVTDDGSSLARIYHFFVLTPPIKLQFYFPEKDETIDSVIPKVDPESQSTQMNREVKS